MFKSFFANQGLGPDFSEVSAWAKRRGHQFKRERDGNGFVVDGKFETCPGGSSGARRSGPTSTARSSGSAWSSACRPTCRC
jgi:hypothetical protein